MARQSPWPPVWPPSRMVLHYPRAERGHDRVGCCECAEENPRDSAPVNKPNSRGGVKRNTARGEGGAERRHTTGLFDAESDACHAWPSARETAGTKEFDVGVLPPEVVPGPHLPAVGRRRAGLEALELLRDQRRG